MSDNNRGNNTARTLRTQDLKSGDELLMAYFPDAGVVTINGYVVNRSPDHETSSKRAVFYRDLGDKLFTVPSESISQLFL